MDTFLIGLENTQIRFWASTWQIFLVKNYCLELYKKKWICQQIIIDGKIVPKDIIELLWNRIMTNIFCEYIRTKFQEYMYKDVILECIYFGRLLAHNKKQGKNIKYDPDKYYAFAWNNTNRELSVY
jgi:hypothetical protein